MKHARSYEMFPVASLPPFSKSQKPSFDSRHDLSNETNSGLGRRDCSLPNHLPLPPRNSPWNLHLPLLLSPANETCRNRRENRRRESVSIWRDNLTLLFGSSREIGWFRRGGLVTKVVSAEQLAFLLPPPRPGVPCTQSSILVVRNGPTCYYFYGHGRTEINCAG